MTEEDLERLKASLDRELKILEAELIAKQAEWQNRRDIERDKILYRRQLQQQMALGVIELGKTATNTMVLVNGGAIVAMLTFVGNLLVKGDLAARATAQQLAPAISYFLLGLVLAILSASFITWAQIAFNNRSAQGRKLRFLASLIALLSLGGFGLGASRALAAFESPPPFYGSELSRPAWETDHGY